MNLNGRERRALSVIADEIMNTAPELAALLMTFNRVESAAAMPVRVEPSCGVMAMPPRRGVVMSGPTRHRRLALLVIASALIGIGLIATVAVLVLTGHGATGVGQNYPWWASSRQGLRT